RQRMDSRMLGAGPFVLAEDAAQFRGHVHLSQVAPRELFQQDLHSARRRQLAIEKQEVLLPDCAAAAAHLVTDLAEQLFLTNFQPDASGQTIELLTNGLAIVVLSICRARTLTF